MLVTKFAPAHSDPAFEEQIFVSLVLRTGSSPYLVQAFHTEYAPTEDMALKFVDTNRCLEVGDIPVLDPTTPHMAAPTVPRAPAPSSYRSSSLSPHVAAEAFRV